MIRADRPPSAHKSFAVGAAPRRRIRLIGSRRAYKSWVADDTIEDYALRFTPPSARRFGLFATADTAFGATSFMALEVIGALVTLADGTAIAVAAILSVGVLLFVLGLPIAHAAARRGIDIDLLTRGAGFGYLGSTATSLVYATFTVIFFAFEASILAESLRIVLGWPLRLGEALAAVAVIPIVMLGMSVISRLQRATQPVWLLLTVLPVLACFHHGAAAGRWLAFGGLSAAHGGTVLAFGSAASVVLSLAPQIGEQVDYLRFLPARTRENRRRWWLAMLVGGPGWIVPGVAKMLIGSALATAALEAGVADPAQPIAMYGHAFGLLLPGGGPTPALLALALIVVAQLKINVTNAYSGSIAWSNFFSRLTRYYPGRAVWVVFNVAIATALLILGLSPITGILVLFSVLAASWIGALFADLAIARPLGLAPRALDHKRAHLHDLNPVGVGAMAVGTAIGLAAAAGLAGAAARAFAPFLALGASVVLVPILAWMTGGRFYVARKPRRAWADGAPACVVCGNGYAAEDTAYCPAYRGAICSLCCTLEARCLDACRPEARAGATLGRLLRRMDWLGSFEEPGRLVLRFTLRLALVAALLAVLLATIWLEARAGSADPERDTRLMAALGRAFVLLVVVGGVVVAALTLAEASRAAALAENERQTATLEAEIRRRVRTDAMLTRAREAAENANHAKSRFIVGAAHELRTPLNTVSGYAQLLELDATLGDTPRARVRAIRLGAEHLARLIEGLLDISKIEAGRIEIERRPVMLATFLDEIVDPFRLQAEARGIGLTFRAAPNLAPLVFTDPTRLRQVLINLLSNALKFTERGEIGLVVTKAGEVTEFAVSDTGRGIAAADQGRIFEPFERAAASAAVPGTGLGLTITRLLTEIMGGAITVASVPGEGSVFRVRLLLSSVGAGDARDLPAPAARGPAPRGYRGRRRLVLAADDDEAQRALLGETLRPLGFDLCTASDGESLLRLERETRAAGRAADLVLLDVSMGGPGALDGWETAERLRAAGMDGRIVMVSAHPEDRAAAARAHHDAFLGKPMSIGALRVLIGRLLDLDWIEADARATARDADGDAASGDPATGDARSGTPASDGDTEGRLPAVGEEDIARLRHLARIGHVRGLCDAVATLARARPDDQRLRALDEAVRGYRLAEVDALLERLA